jgi:hypothetical protein
MGDILESYNPPDFADYQSTIFENNTSAAVEHVLVARQADERAVVVGAGHAHGEQRQLYHAHDWHSRSAGDDVARQR